MVTALSWCHLPPLKLWGASFPFCHPYLKKKKKTLVAKNPRIGCQFLKTVVNGNLATLTLKPCHVVGLLIWLRTHWSCFRLQISESRTWNTDVMLLKDSRQIFPFETGNIDWMNSYFVKCFQTSHLQHGKNIRGEQVQSPDGGGWDPLNNPFGLLLRTTGVIILNTARIGNGLITRVLDYSVIPMAYIMFTLRRHWLTTRQTSNQSTRWWRYSCVGGGEQREGWLCWGERRLHLLIESLEYWNAQRVIGIQPPSAFVSPLFHKLEQSILGYDLVE